ncbi:hypothetical protein ScPMuIL_010513 [Solemya velum]
MAQHDHIDLWNGANEDLFRNQFPLHRVCRDGDLETLSLLLENSAELNFYEEDGLYGWTPTHWAAYFGKLACLRKIITLLPMSRGDKCDIATYRFRQTPLHLAAFSGHPACIQWLVQSGAHINFQDYMGETPIHKAARAGSMECINLLISQGANLRTKNYHGWTPAELANESDHKECGNVLTQALETQVQKDPIRVSSSPDLSTFPISIPAPDHPINHTSEGINGGFIPSLDQPSNDSDSDNVCSSKGNQSHCDMETCDSDEFVEDNATRFGLPGIVTVGRKRCLDDFIDECSIKKIRHGEPVIRDMYSGLPVKIHGIANGGTNGSLANNHITTSAVEHCSSLSMEQGYENLYINTISNS